jgi:hypothetical protein
LCPCFAAAAARCGARPGTLLSYLASRLSSMNTYLTLLTGGGLTAAGVVASGLLANWLGSRRDKRGYEHEQEMAREARSQERLDQAYIALGEYLSRFGDWARSVHPFLGPVPGPDPLQPGERWRIEALVTAYGSEEVQRLLDRWGECAQRIENADVVIRMADESRDPSPELDQDALRERHALEDYRKAMRDAADAIRDQIQRELAPGASHYSQRPELKG